MRALIVVDVQNDFVEGGALAVPGGREIIPALNSLQQLFEVVVAVQDWHPASHGSFFTNHLGRKAGEVIVLNGLPQILWPPHCIQDTPGAAFVSQLDTTRIAHVFHKGTDPGIDSYSAFYDNGHTKATGMGDFLKARGVKETFLAGLATDYCVKFSAFDSVGLGFKTHVIPDACRGINLTPGDVDRAVAEMKDAGVTFIRSR